MSGLATLLYIFVIVLRDVLEDIPMYEYCQVWRWFALNF